MNDASKDDWLDLLLSHLIEPKLGMSAPLFIYDYPASQAALAKTREEAGVKVAQRFEVYVNGIELANGFHELTDATEQRQRFTQDLALRQEKELEVPPLDENLLTALDADFPECAGVALGIDRLLMLQQNLISIKETLSFDVSRI
jgi:elongation factor P--(R)-beta-lysine ligase